VGCLFVYDPFLRQIENAFKQYLVPRLLALISSVVLKSRLGRLARSSGKGRYRIPLNCLGLREGNRVLFVDRENMGSRMRSKISRGTHRKPAFTGLTKSPEFVSGPRPLFNLFVKDGNYLVLLTVFTVLHGSVPLSKGEL
jgi:hypothetical protein